MVCTAQGSLCGRTFDPLTTSSHRAPLCVCPSCKVRPGQGGRCPTTSGVVSEQCNITSKSDSDAVHANGSCSRCRSPQYHERCECSAALKEKQLRTASLPSFLNETPSSVPTSTMALVLLTSLFSRRVVARLDGRCVPRAWFLLIASCFCVMEVWSPLLAWWCGFRCVVCRKRHCVTQMCPSGTPTFRRVRAGYVHGAYLRVSLAC